MFIYNRKKYIFPSCAHNAMQKKKHEGPEPYVVRSNISYTSHAIIQVQILTKQTNLAALKILPQSRPRS